MSVEREIKARIVEKFKCREFIYLGNTVLIIELKSKEETVELTDAVSYTHLMLLPFPLYITYIG